MSIRDKAIKRKQELLKEIEQIDAFISMYDKLQEDESVTQESASARPRRFFRAASTPAQIAATQGIVSLSPLLRPSGESKKDAIEQATEKILRESQPMHTADLVKRLAEMGVPVGGTDEVLNLSSYLSKSTKFVNRRKDGGWFLAGEEKSPDGGNQGGILDLT